MPAFDISAFFVQIFFSFAFFILFYLFVLKYLMVQIARVQKMRKKLKAHTQSYEMKKKEKKLTSEGDNLYQEVIQNWK